MTCVPSWVVYTCSVATGEERLELTIRQTRENVKVAIEKKTNKKTSYAYKSLLRIVSDKPQPVALFDSSESGTYRGLEPVVQLFLQSCDNQFLAESIDYYVN